MKLPKKMKLPNTMTLPNLQSTIKFRIILFIVCCILFMLLVVFIKYKLPLYGLLVLIIIIGIFVQYWQVKNNYYIY
jgi:hypothetical protein